MKAQLGSILDHMHAGEQARDGVFDRRAMLRLLGVAASLPLLGTGAAPINPPSRYWSWSIPRGTAAYQSNITPLVRLKVHTLLGHQTAIEIGKVLQLRRALTPDIGVCLQNFGMAQGNPSGPSWKTGGTTALMMAWKDGVASDTSSAWWATPWFKHGIAHCRAWMHALLDAWPAAGPSAMPAPSRFFFDTERWPSLGISARGIVSTFLAMQKDPRWSTEPIPGFDTSIEDLWAQAGKPSVTTGTWFDPMNRMWARWYQGVCYTAADAAMKAAAYDPIRSRFPSCRSTNYGTATSLDGVDGRWSVVPGHDWCTFRHRAAADLLSPIYYWPPPSQSANDDALSDQTVQWARKNLEDMVSSWGGTPAQQIVPWIQLPGEQREDRGRQRTQSAALTMRLLSMFGAIGVTDCVVWYNDVSATTANWDAMVTAIERARQGTQG